MANPQLVEGRSFGKFKGWTQQKAAHPSTSSGRTAFTGHCSHPPFHVPFRVNRALMMGKTYGMV